MTKQGNTAKAQQVLEHCLEHVNPKGSEIAYSLGTLYLDQEQYDQAVRCMNISLEVDQGDADAMLVMARACAGRQDNAGEKAWYQRIVPAPGSSKEVAGKAYCNLGSSQEIEYYEKSLQLVPECFPAAFSLARAYASKQQWDRAVTAFRTSIDLAPEGSDDERQALKNLYRVTMSKLQQDHPSGASSQEEMMKLFTNIMGDANFQKLSAMRRQ